MIKTSGKSYRLINQLKELKKDFIVLKTTKSTVIKFDAYSYMFADSHFSNKHLNLFQRIKKEVHNNITQHELIPPPINKSK